MIGVEPAPVEAAGLRKESLTEKVAIGIRRAILTGRFQLGQKLREADLAREYGVSHSVIREALHMLQGEGMVVTKPYCGRSVLRLSVEEAQELTVMRASLECYAAFLAARKLTPESADRIEQAAIRMKSEQPRDYAQWVALEMSFHRTIWEASGNELLVRQLSQVAIPTYALGTLQLFPLDFDPLDFGRTTSQWEQTNSFRGHQPLAAAIRSKD
ncbi:MAG: GntR family transcriptional regulator, partial [Bryobacteraceae bacterium]